MNTYSIREIAQAFRGEGTEETRADIERELSRLLPIERVFLYLYSQGYSLHTQSLMVSLVHLWILINEKEIE